MLQRKVGRRDVLKLGGASALVGALGVTGPTACTNRYTAAPTPDDYADLVLSDYATGARPLLACAGRYLPELQMAPVPASLEAVEGRIQVASALQEEIAAMPTQRVIQTLLPVALRYPAWLATGVNLGIFEVVLGHTALEAFELHGIAMEHLDPYIALIDMALRPLCTALHARDRTLHETAATAVERQIEALQGRLFLFGERRLTRILEAIRAMLAYDDTPVFVRVVGAVDNDDEAPLTVEVQHDTPQAGDVHWRLNAGLDAWERIVPIVGPDRRTIDQVVGNLLLGSLFLRCR